MTIKEVLKWGFGMLDSTSDSARLDAEILLAHVLKRPLTFLLAHDEQKISSIKQWKYRRLIRQRKQGIPVAYLTGHKEFFCLDFFVNRHVLVPRPDTEILADEVVSYFKSEIRSTKSETNSKSEILNSKPFRASNFDIRNFILVDVGTGSGVIPISILKNVPGLTAVALDISSKALAVAKKNAKRHGVLDRLRLVRSDLLKNADPAWFEGREVVVTANLPYLPDSMPATDRSRATWPASRELTFEPSIALYAGADGMDVYRRFALEVQKLKPRAVFLELFSNQVAIFESLMPGYRVRECKPLTGDARCLILERN